MKKKKSPLLSVSLFLLAGFGILGWMLLSYGASDKAHEGINVTVEFSDASGIIEGGLVRLSGANVGYVSAPPPLNERLRVNVPLSIRDDINIPANATFKIVPLSMLGDKAIYIVHPDEPVAERLKSGTHFIGNSPKGLDSLQQEAETLTIQVKEILAKSDATFEIVNHTLAKYAETADHLNTSLARLNNSILSEESLAGINATIANLDSATQEVEKFSKSLAPMAAETRLTLSQFTDTATKTNKLVSTASDRMDELAPVLKTLPETLDTYSKLGKTYTEVGQTLQSAISSDDSLVGALTSDSEMKQDAKSFVKNLKNNGILGYKDNATNEEDPRDRYRGVRR